MRSRVFLFLFPLLLALGGPAFARGGGTLDSILPEIRAQHPGRLSDAEPFTAPDGSTHYRIKWMTPEGRILYFDADARSGHYYNSAGDEGGGWHRGGEGQGHWRDGGDSQTGGAEDDNAGRHRDWNGGGNEDHGGSGDWTRDRDTGRAWPGPGGGGDWHGGLGNWGGGRGDWGGRGGGDWRGGHGSGDHGGPHHHGG
jgi:hypothetical protein